MGPPARWGTRPDVPPRPALCAPRPPLGARPDVPPRRPASVWGLGPTSRVSRVAPTPGGRWGSKKLAPIYSAPRTKRSLPYVSRTRVYQRDSAQEPPTEVIFCHEGTRTPRDAPHTTPVAPSGPRGRMDRRHPPQARGWGVHHPYMATPTRAADPAQGRIGCG